MGEVQDRWDASIEAEWTAFRGRLADAIAALNDDRVIVVGLGSLGDHGPSNGAAPYVQFIGWGGELVRAEVSSNVYLDPAYALEIEAYDEMHELGWGMPTYGEDEESDHGSANFWLDGQTREADRLAWMGVGALREVFGCVHPSFLTRSGMDEESPAPVVEPIQEPDEERVVVFAKDRDELHAHVVTALQVLLDEPEVKVDADGDVPIRTGRSVMFVRVLEQRPAIDVFAQIVLGPTDRERLAVELDILNRTHPLATFYTDGHAVVMSHRMMATPFVPMQLRIVVDRLLDDLDQIATTLAQRVGGRCYLDPAPAEPETVAEDCPAMVGLVELMSMGRVASSTVVELFEHDRRELVRMIVAVRSGHRDCGEADEDAVLDHLRRGLDLVARNEARATRAASRLAAGGSAQQMSLLEPDIVMRARRPRRTA